ncbi:insulinase family protein [bacterium]|nr:insulinase family protein [bacterium]
MGLLRGLVGIWVLVLSTSSHAASVFWEGRINGYRTVFLNTGFGNRIHVGTSVPVGMGLDEPKHLAGMAHLIEHQVFRRTKKFEDGERELEKLIRFYGGDYNAGTTLQDTSFHLSGHLDGAGGMIRHLGAMFSGYAPNATSFTPEAKVVIEESLEFRAQDVTVAEEAPYTELLPKRHYRNKYTVGQGRQLSRIDLDTALNYYYANYQPQFVTILVTGNFSQIDSATVNNLRQEIQESFYAPVDERTKPAGRAVVPGPLVKVGPLVGSPRQKRIVEVNTEASVRKMSVVFELPAEIAESQDDAVDVLSRLLLLDIPGGFVQKLKSQGWIEAAAGTRAFENDLRTVTFTFELKEKGYPHRYEILTQLFALLAELSKNGVSDDAVQIAAQKIVAAFEKSASNPDELFWNVVPGLRRKDISLERFLDSRGRFGGITSDQVSGLAGKAFSPDRALVTYLGPEVEGTYTSTAFGRRCQYVDKTVWLPVWKEAWKGKGSSKTAFSPTRGSIAINHAQERVWSQEARVTSETEAGNTLVAYESGSVEKSGHLVRVLFPVLSLKEQAAFILFEAALRIHNASEKEVFDMEGLWDGIDAYSTGEACLRLTGDREAAVSALKWYWDRRSRFQPTREELEGALETLQSELDGESQQFTQWFAARAIRELRSVTGTTFEQRVAAAKELLDPGTLMEVVSGLQSRADIRVVSMGDVNIASAKRLAEQVRAHIPQPLTDADRKQRHKGFSNAHSLQAWRPLPEGKEEGAVAAVREFGPVVGLTSDQAAFEVLRDLMATEIFIKNRSEKGLGYVHGASLHFTESGASYLGIFGQANGGAAQLDDIVAGWKDVLAMVRNREISPETIAASQAGIVRKNSLLPNSASAFAQELDELHERYGRTDARQALVDAVARLTPEDLYRTAQKYFDEMPYVELMTSAEMPSDRPCAKEIIEFGRARETLVSDD